jgi:uncharacterized protein RhaS with RHS repeats
VQPKIAAPTIVGAAVFSYDAAGNMTTGLEGRSIAYDASNRPTQVSWRGATTDYLYGPDGERVKKLTAAGTTLYLGDTELTPAGRTIMHPHPDVRLVDGVESFLHRDHLASVTVITDDTGATITTRDYTPHGDMEGHEWVDPLSQPEGKAYARFQQWARALCDDLFQAFRVALQGGRLQGALL